MTYNPHAPNNGDSYQDQIRAWRDEQARLAARPWWRKATGAASDFADRHRVAILLLTSAFGLALAVAILALLIAWLSSW